jgi:hypothetical protein
MATQRQPPPEVVGCTLLFSKYNKACTDLIAYLHKYSLIGTHIVPVCVDSKDIHDKIVSSGVISSVPTVIVDTADGMIEIHEGNDAIQWINGAIEQTIQQMPRKGGGRQLSRKEQLQERHNIELQIRKRAYDKGQDPDQAVKAYFGEEDEEDEDEETEDPSPSAPQRPHPRGKARSKDFMVGGQEDEGFLDINDPSASGQYSSLGDVTEEEPDVPRPSRMRAQRAQRGKVDVKELIAKMAEERNEMGGFN